MKRILSESDKPLHVVGSTKLYVRARLLAELVTLILCERLTVTAILDCSFYDQFVERIYPKTRSVKPINGSTALVIQ